MGYIDTKIMDCNPFLIDYNRLLSKFIETDHKNSI